MVYATVVNRLAPENSHVAREREISSSSQHFSGDMIYVYIDVTQVNTSKFQFYRPKSSENRLLGYVAAYPMVLHDTLNGNSFHKSSLSSLLISEIQDHLRCIKTL